MTSVHFGGAYVSRLTGLDSREHGDFDARITVRNDENGNHADRFRSIVGPTANEDEFSLNFSQNSYAIDDSTQLLAGDYIETREPSENSLVDFLFATPADGGQKKISGAENKQLVAELIDELGSVDPTVRANLKQRLNYVY